MKFPPSFILFALGLIFLGLALAGNPSAADWFWRGFVYATSAGFVWSLFPEIFGEERAGPRELFPVGMLFLFLLVISEARGRISADALFHTALGLVAFRTILFMARTQGRSSKKAGAWAIAWFLAWSLELILNGLRVYFSFRPLSIPPEWMGWVETKGLLVLLSAGWMVFRGFRPALVPGVALAMLPSTQSLGFLFSGAGWMVEWWLYQRDFKKTLS